MVSTKSTSPATWATIRVADRKSTRLNSKSPCNLVCRLLLEKKRARGVLPGRRGESLHLDQLAPRASRGEGVGAGRVGGRGRGSRRTGSALFFLMIRRPPRSTLFPYPTLFRPRGAPVPGPWRPTSSPPPTGAPPAPAATARSEEHTSELQSPCNLVCRLLLE